MPVEHVVSLEYLICFIVLHCVLAAFCQLLLNEYLILSYLSTCMMRAQTTEADSAYAQSFFYEPWWHQYRGLKCICLETDCDADQDGGTG